MANSTADLSRDGWDLSRRIEAWAGEMRVNVIRILAIAIFYSRHLIEMFLSPRDAPIRGMYHLRVTAVIIAWAGVAATVHILLSRRIYPPMMKFATALLDVLMITLLCTIAGGPQTPLVLLYFLAIGTAPLRLSLPLVYVTTLASIVGYLSVLAWYAWHVVGFHTYYATPSLRIPRSQEIITVLSLGVAGLLAGQMVRQARRMVERCPSILSAQEGRA